MEAKRWLPWGVRLRKMKEHINSVGLAGLHLGNVGGSDHRARACAAADAYFNSVSQKWRKTRPGAAKGALEVRWSGEGRGSNLRTDGLRPVANPRTSCPLHSSLQIKAMKNLQKANSYLSMAELRNGQSELRSSLPNASRWKHELWWTDTLIYSLPSVLD